MTDQATQTTTGEVEVLDDRAAQLNPDTDAALAAQQEATAAIVAAADFAMSLPEAPGAQEFMTLAATARLVSMSGAAPELVRDDPYLAFHIALVGRDFGISPSAALNLVDVIPGRDGPQISLSPLLINAQVKRLGLGEIVQGETTYTYGVAWAIGPGGTDPRCRRRKMDHVDDCACDLIGSTEFTWEDAQIAGLAGPQCQPGNHPGQKWKCGCNTGYITYPRRMMTWRAAGFCADDHFPEASLGLYTPEALGAMVDGSGRAIDPGSVALPEGFEPPPKEAPASPAEISWVERLFDVLTTDDHPKLRLVRQRYVEQVGKGVKPDAAPASLLRKFIQRATKIMGAELDSIMAKPPETPAAEPETEPTPPEPEPEPEGVPAAEALAVRGKPVGIDEFTEVCHAADITVPDAVNMIAAAIKAAGRDWGTESTYEGLVAFEPEVFSAAHEIMTSGEPLTVEALTAAAQEAAE